ncbi:MAG TPA: penicillin acylase family protein [Natronosporangium sp.]
MARPWSRRLLWIGSCSLAVLLLLLTVGGGYAYWSSRRPFPTHDGELRLPGLTAPVTVYRDGHGIPQIYAASIEDLFRAQGFVHAQDRFWEMDFRRHVTAGRLSELFGPDQLETDKFLRTLGWRRVAEAEWEAASADSRRYLTAYAEGVNAWIEATGGPADTGRKALQYRILGLQNAGYEVEPWHPADTLAWLKAMAWDLRTNLESELERAWLVAAGLSRDQIEQLFPPYPYQQHPPILADDGSDDGSAGGTGGSLGSGPVVADAGLGSNSWVVSGEHTALGGPILVNDPHLSPSLPGIWYQIGLHCDCGYRVSGFSFSGVPGVVIGHNDRIAWGFTNLGHDVTDLYLERVDGDRYLLDGEWQPLTVREETIRVAGGDNVTIRVRQTHRGPLLSDHSEDFRELAASERLLADLGATSGEHAISLAWTALRPGHTIDALFVLNQARDWDGFRAAAALFEVPAQNLIYADVDGNIGYQAPGVVPVRAAGDGRWLSPGWESSYGWEGTVPFDDLPQLLNPPDGVIVTANQAVVGPDYPALLTTDWGYGYRSDRIRDALDAAIAAGPVDVSTMEDILFDNRNPFAPVLVPALLAAPADGDVREARDLLRDWDYQQPTDSPAAAYFNAVWRQLLLLTFDELPEDYRPAGNGRWFQVVGELLEDPASPWWDRLDTTQVETRDDLLARAMVEARRELGGDPADWEWGDLHTLTLRDASFGNSGIGPIEAIFNRGPVATAGGSDIVNATAWNAAEGYEVTAVPSMRMVIDLSDLDDARWVQLTGNSGHPYHDNYTDQLELWRTGQLLPWRWHRSSIENEAEATLTLRP